MYLKRLEIYGFKTFAQRTVFEFPPGVTAVVGPNGSGKSNVADALRWVLGEQSFANLRSKRTEDLIFGGGKGRAPMGFAEVFLTIDNSDRLLPLPYDEVTIGRRAYRSGENEYTINRARVRLRDVADAVSPLGSSYTLINQGLVDSVLALQPEDRRRLFEDAAEIGPYQAKKQEAQRRLRETEANLVRLSDVVGELEPQLRTLRRQARDAEAVGAVEAELQALLRQWYARQWAVTTECWQVAASAAAHSTAELASARAAREAIASKLLVAREQIRNLRAAVEQQQQASAEHHQQLDTVVRELAVTAERVAGFDERHADLERRVQALHANQAAAEARVQQVAEQVAATRAALSDEQRRLAELEVGREREYQARREAEQQLAARREALVGVSAALDAERSRHAELQRRQAALHATDAELAAAVAQSRQRGVQLVEAAQAAQQAVTAAEQLTGDASALADTHRAALEQLHREREHSDEQITAAKRALTELQARYDALARLARSFEGTFAGVRAALQWAAREQRAGFVLVSTVLRVPAELETAIEVALGSRLQQIVVERWADAEAAIAHLKQAGSGRATFLPLDTLKPSRRVAAPPSFGLRGVAADLVEVAEQYAPIRSYLLGRTLVADDLVSARRALGQLEGGWTIVTLSGEQIAAGGAVTGGAATKESGTLRRERELRDLPAQVTAARQTVAWHEAERAALLGRMDSIQAALRDAERQLRDARAERDQRQRAAEARQREANRAEDELAALLRRQAGLHHEQTELEHVAAQRAAAVAAGQREVAEAQAAVTAAQAAVDEQRAAAGSDEAELRAQRAVVTRLDAEARSLAAEQHAQRLETQRAQTEAAALQQQLEQLRQEQAQLGQRLTALQAEHTVLQAEASQQVSILAAARQTVTEQAQALDLLEAQERDLTARTLAAEGAHADAVIQEERSRSERDHVWERAAEDAIDLEALPPQAAPILSAADHELAPRIEQLRSRLRRMGPVNALAPAEFDAAQQRHHFLSEQLADVRSAVATLRDAIAQLDQVMHEHFETTFSAVAREFSRTFTQLFGGGTARLALVRDADSAESVQGIDIVVQPPGKRQLNLQLLSGGERALTAAALLFAILTVNPSPFCMLDEVDAALDEANVVRFREALLELAQQTQFILITHNRGTVEAADTLYGITMQADLGISKVVSLRLQEIDETLQLRT